MNAADVQARTAGGNEDVAAVAVANELLATLKVVGQRGACRRMKRYQAGSTQLCSSDRQHTLIEIDVVELQIERFGNAQTGHAQQTEKAMEHPRSQGRGSSWCWQFSAASKRRCTSCSVYRCGLARVDRYGKSSTGGI